MIVGAKTDMSIFLSHVAITIIVALIASLFIAQTLVPMLASRIAVPPQPKSGAWMSRLTSRYVASLEWILGHRWWTALGIGLVCFIGILPLLLDLVKFDMFPQDVGRRLFMPYHVEGQHSLERIEQNVDKIEEYLYSRQEEFNIRSIYSYYDQGRAESTILLTEKDDATLSTKEVIALIEADLPQLAIGKPSFSFEQQGGGEGFTLQISGDSTEVLNDLAVEIGNKEVRVIIDRTRAANVGLTTQAIAQSVSIAMRGENLREFRDQNGEIAVRLAFRDNDKQSVEQLANLPLYTPDGRRITLGTVASLHVGRAPDTIRRTDRQTAVILSANLEEDVTADDVRPRVNSMMEQIELPAGYSWKEGRGFEQQDETADMMATNILLGIACIFLVLFFAATGTTFSFMAMIGIMILIGVVVNNGIVLVDHINNLRQDGVSRDKAIVIAGRDRLRPILMTVATTIVGLAPLAMGTTQVGGDGPPYYPMARAIIGGLAFSTVVSLLVVPALYVYFDSLAAWGRKVMRTARQGRAHAVKA